MNHWLQFYFPLCGIFCALGGCGTLSYTIQTEDFIELSSDNKVLLFDAENEIAMVMDAHDELQKEIFMIKRDIRLTNKQLEAAEIALDKASDEDNVKAEQVAELAVSVFLKKLTYLDEKLEIANEKYDTHEVVLHVALAKYELAKAMLVRKFNLADAQDIEIVDFEEQIKDFEEDAQERTASFAELEQSAEALKKDWLAERDKLARASGGGWGSPWVEDVQ